MLLSNSGLLKLLSISVEHFDFLLNVLHVQKKKNCSTTIFAILNELDMLGKLFKLCPHMAPEAIRLNHIPDMPPRSSGPPFISAFMPSAILCDRLNEQLQHAAALRLSLWWHIILKL